MHLDDFMQHLSKLIISREYLYRGESREFPDVSSGLFRLLGQPHPILSETQLMPSIKEIEKRALRKILSSTDHDDPHRARIELQHHGGKTNLIDFTKDINIALFFASITDDNHDGRIVLLRAYPSHQPQQTDYSIVEGPIGPRHLMAAQKSVLVEPHDGVLSEVNLQFLRVPKELKTSILDHLHKQYGVTLDTVFNDISAFTRNPYSMLEPQVLYTAGVLAYFTGQHHQAIEALTGVICNPKAPGRSRRCLVYFHRGLSYWKLGRRDEALIDLAKVLNTQFSDKDHFVEEVKKELPLDVFLKLQNDVEVDLVNTDKSLVDDSNGSRIIIQTDKNDANIDFLIASDSGYQYLIRITQYSTSVNLPSGIGSYPCHIWFTKDLYRGVHDMPIEIENKYCVMLSPTMLQFAPVETVQQPTIKVEIEWQPLP